MVVLVVCLLASMAIAIVRLATTPTEILGDGFRGLPAHARPTSGVSISAVQRPSRGGARCSLASWLGPMDRRPPAEAVRQAIDLAKLSGAALSIVSAYAPVSKGASRASRSMRRPTSSMRSALARTSTSSSTPPPRRPSKAGVEAQTHPVEGEPAEAILTVAEETKADLIVVGNKGMSGARRFLLGSVPNNVSHHAPCSVIIVRTT